MVGTGLDRLKPPADNRVDMLQAHTPPPRWQGHAGFSLVELMIAVVVVGVLGAIAFPAFTDAVRKSRRAEAVTALSSVQQAQERWRGNQSSYTTSLTAAPTADPAGLGLSSNTPGGYYTVTIDAANATSYTSTATAVSGTSQANDGNCARLRVRMDGGNVVYGSAAASGDFNESSSNSCWSR
jgi:type IV pilus assembly protein PilE